MLDLDIKIIKTETPKEKAKSFADKVKKSGMVL